MKDYLPKLDGTRLLIALKTLLAVSLGCYIVFLLDWKPSFTLILIVILQTPAMGATIKKGLMYFTATATGSIASLALVGLFAHDRRLFILAFALLTGFGIYRMQGSRYTYVWLIFMVTAALVGFFSCQDVPNTFSIAVMRTSTIALAVTVAFLVHGILWPIRAGKAFEGQLHAYLDGCRKLIALTTKALAGDAPDRDAAKKLIGAQAKLIGALRDSLAAAVDDTDRLRRFLPGYQQLIDRLDDLLLVILALREATASGPDGRASIPSESCERFVLTLKDLEHELAELLQDLALPRNGTAEPRESAAVRKLDMGEAGLIDRAQVAMVTGCINDLARQVAVVRASLATVEDPTQVPQPLPPPAREPFRLTSARFRKAASGGVAIFLVTWLFILTQWPNGLKLGMVFATVAIAFTGMLPLVMVGRQLLASLVISLAIAAPLYLGIMPRISGYEQLIPWICVGLFPLLYAMTKNNPKTFMQYLFSAIFVLALLSLDEESQVYSFSSLITTWFSLCGGFVLPLAIYGLFSSLVPERELWKNVCAFFGGSARSMQDLQKNPPATPAGAAIVKAGRKRWQGIFRQLHVWPNAIDYKRVQGNDRQATQALVESIEHVEIRLMCAEHARRGPVDARVGALREPLHQLYDSCARSLDLVAKSLTDLVPIPDLPDTHGLVQELESRSNEMRRSAAGDGEIEAAALNVMCVSAHLGSLADAIQDCRLKANALDWAAWNRNHF